MRKTGEATKFLGLSASENVRSFVKKMLRMLG
jgi:hypothetical protein